MQCPECQFENPADSNFCLECGQKLEQKCPQCEKVLPVGAKFCNGCGHKLITKSTPSQKEPSFDEKLDKIQKYLPKGLTEKILSQRNRIEGERKQVTVMFVDMEGFTQLSEKLGPEEAYSVMDQIYEILIHKVHDYEGTVNEFTGDGIMALFGAPIALEDAPQRAIRSAYAVHREMTRFNDKMKQEKANIPQIKMRIGIHTGSVVVGTLGNDLRVEFKAVGDTVNLASRMERLAEPGSTYVTDETFKLTEGLFRFEALGDYAIKGKEGKVKAYRVIAPSTSRTRFDVSAERGLTRFVGRERELELLLDGFDRSKTGRGQAFSIVAEAGVGKSRLLYEFRKAVSNEDVTFQEGKCLSYSKGIAYHPVIDIVKSNFDIEAGDGDFEITEKLKRGLKILEADETSTLPYLLELLSVIDSGMDTKTLSPEARKDRIIEAIKRISIKSSQIRPLIIAIEDLHWIDKSSEDYLKALLDSVSGARVFLIFTYRPEYVPTWGGKSYHNQITLNRLSNRESLTMVNNLLGSKDIESDFAELILEKTEGIPFFIEEFIKSLRDLNFIERKDETFRLAKGMQAVSIPSTIQDVIMARVDTLPEDAKELLQTASVIEREFNHALIVQVSGLSEQQLLSQLSVLKEAELLFERGIYPESTYIFKHALTREVVYNSILARRQKELHNEIGMTIEQLYNHNLHDYYGILAEHFINSENYDNAAKYCRLAGKKAEKAGSLNDAIGCGEKQVACFEKLPQTEDVEINLIDARTILGLYFAQLGNFNKAKAVIDPIVDLATKRNYNKRISHLYTIIGGYTGFAEENSSRAFEYFEKSLTIGKELNDPLSLVLSNNWMAQSLCLNCEYDKALHCWKSALEINIRANSLWGISAMKANMAIFVYAQQGKIDLAYETSKETLRIADESGDVFSKAQAYTAHGWSYYHKGYLKEAEEYLSKGAELSERINMFYLAGMARFGLADTYFDRGEYKISQKHYERLIFHYRQNRLLPSLLNLSQVAIGRAKIMNNEKNISLDELFKCHDDIKSKLWKSSGHYYLSDILLNIDDRPISEAEDWIKKAIQSHKQYGMVWFLARDYALYGDLFKRKNDQKKAKEHLAKAIEIFQECGADGWAKKYEKELAVLA
ncbi:MAG: adenylate/guanylate cyclase domain-containing protein [Desulfobacterales bacterium]